MWTGFAARLAATHVRGAGEAIRHTRKALRAGVAWWRAGTSNSAGAAAAARSPAFGLLWSDDPARAAYEAALSATVTHGHPAAVAGAAAFASAIALAAKGNGPLDNRWLADVADICEEYPQGDVYGATVADRIRQIPNIPRTDLMDALREIGPSALATDAIPAALLGATAAPVPVPVARTMAGPSFSWGPFRTVTRRRCGWGWTMGRCRISGGTSTGFMRRSRAWTERWASIGVRPARNGCRGERRSSGRRRRWGRIIGGGGGVDLSSPADADIPPESLARNISSAARGRERGLPDG